jgi:ribulose-5-phosphate 4-epimerase/fuculose-1-phosphate aldolase
MKIGTQNPIPGNGVRRREFLAGSLFAVLSGAARPILGQQLPVSAGPGSPELVADLVAANRILAQEGVVDAFGHVSVRHNLNPNRFLLSRSLAPALVTADDLIEYDLDGNAVNANGGGQYSERFIHGEIYKARPDVRSVVHAHAPSVVPFGVSTVPLRPVFHMAAFIGDSVPIFDIRKGAGMTDMLVRDSSRGRALAQALGNKPAVLMRGHGMTVVGPALPFAVGRSIYLELNARVQLQAMALGGRGDKAGPGGEITYLDPAEAKAVMDSGENRSYERAWELWKRKVQTR